MSLPRISWHIGDYLKDTGHLRAAGHGAYFMLCMHYYANGSLPNDDRQLAAIARMSDKEWREHKSIVQAFFHDGWLHKRIDKEIETANEKYLARAAAGKLGGEAKAIGKQKSSNATNLLEPSHYNATAKSYQPITLTDNQKKEEDGADAPKYAFESGVICLNEKDFSNWKSSFSYLDVPAELVGMSDWASKQESWFHAVKGLLAKRNRAAKAAADKAKEDGGFKYMSGTPGVV